MVAATELDIDESATAGQMAQELFGDDVTIIGATYTGATNSSGIYSNGDATSPGVLPADSGVILSTGNAADFTNATGSGNANQSTNTSTNTTGPSNDPLFGNGTNDASYLTMQFQSDQPVMTMKFVFSSEEYPEYTSSIYQDFVGVWINGTQVDLTVGDGDADPGNINAGDNENLFVDNTGSDYNTEMDGFTVTLTLTFPVDTTPGATNTLIIGIADVGDSNYDSNLLIAADSLQSELVAVDDSVQMYPNGQVTLDVLDNDNSSTGATLTITHINDVAVVAGDTVLLNTGQTVQLNADGTIDVIGNGDTEDYNFNYTITDGTLTDTAFVSVTAFPCFAAGTLIATPGGDRRVETLRPGDLVLTSDEGAQEIRWSGQRHVAAVGDMAPVRIAAGTFGAHDALTVSPQHRILIRDSRAELFFGEAEVLVPAQFLVNGQTIRSDPGGSLVYVHLLFDRHQVILSSGLETESLMPGPQATAVLDAAAMDDIRRIFPGLDPETGEGYGPAARRVLKRHEAALLMAPAAQKEAA